MFNQYFEAPDKNTGPSTETSTVIPETPELFIDPGAAAMFGDSDKTLDDLIKEDNQTPADKEPKEEGKIEGTEENEEGTKEKSEGTDVKPDETKTPENEPEGPDEEVYLIPEISDKEISKEQIIEAFKTYNNLETWRKNLTQRSQLQSIFDDLPPEEQAVALSRLKPIISGRSPLPKSFDKSKPITLKTRDEDGYEVEVKLDWDSEEVKSIGEQIRVEMEKEYEPLRSELKTLKEEKLKGDNALGALVLTYFLDNHPELDIRDPNQKVWDAMETISKAGENHPKFSNFIKLNTLMQSVINNQIYGPDAMERAYKLLFGNNVPPAKRDIKLEQKILEDQKKKMSIGAGASSDAKSEEEKILEKSVDVYAKTQLDLINDAINKK